MRHRRRKLAGALAAGALAAGLTIAGTGTAHALPTPPANTWAEIYAPEINANHITLCVDNNRSTGALTFLQLWSCHGYDSSGGYPQRWVFEFEGYWLGGTVPLYKIANINSGQCIGLHVGYVDNGRIAGSPLVQTACISNLVDWMFVPATNSPDPNNQFILVNAYDAVSHPYAMEANTFLDQNGNRLIAEPEDSWNSAQWFALG
jgi:hypothetical protein